MPTDIRRYGPLWKCFSARIRFVRAQGQCECTGQCGMHTPNPTPRRCVERHGKPGYFTKGKIVLTVAHLCQCSPPCTNPAHVIATCQRCHLRIDRALHAAHRKETLKRRARTPQDAPPPTPKG